MLVYNVEFFLFIGLIKIIFFDFKVFVFRFIIVSGSVKSLGNVLECISGLVGFL